MFIPTRSRQHEPLPAWIPCGIPAGKEEAGAAVMLLLWHEATHSPDPRSQSPFPCDCECNGICSTLDQRQTSITGCNHLLLLVAEAAAVPGDRRVLPVRRDCWLTRLLPGVGIGSLCLQRWQNNCNYTNCKSVNVFALHDNCNQDQCDETWMIKYAGTAAADDGIIYPHHPE